MRKNHISKILAFGVLVLFIGVTIIPSIIGREIPGVSTYNSGIVISVTDPNNGSLSGYIKDTLMNPISGARVRVSFHDTYEEDYSDDEGYYHVTNIPICYCLKNASCSKECYTTECVLLPIVENTTYDFILNLSNHPPNAPIITGPKSVQSRSIKVNLKNPANFPPGTHEFRFKATDPDDDNICYCIDWGDGTCKLWTGFYPSGQELIVNHTYKQGDYIVSALAKDTCGLCGPTGTIDIPIKRNKDCSCEKVCIKDLIKLERLVNSLKVYVHLILLGNPYKSEITNNCQNILDILNSDDFWEDFCDVVGNLITYLQNLINYYGGIFKLLTPLFKALLSIWMFFCWLY